jgi:urease accessory protein
MAGITRSHDGNHSHSHSHDTFNPAEHGHSHEILDGPGSYLGREMPIVEGRNWADRAFTVGIGGYVATSLFLPPSQGNKHLPSLPIALACQ